MDASENPYKPGGGIRPAALIGRDDEIEMFDVLLSRLEAGMADQCIMISGLRGVGKTVLLNAYEDRAIQRGWQVNVFEAGSSFSLAEMIENWVRSSLVGLGPSKSLLRRAFDQLARLQSCTVGLSSSGDVTFNVTAAVQETPEVLHLDLPPLLVELGKIAAEVKTGAVLLIDEAHCLEEREFAPLLAGFHRVTQKSLPVSLVCAGLPQLPLVAVKAKSYAERLFDFNKIGQLDHQDSVDAITDPASEKGVEWEPDAIEHICDLSDGYPFFLQQYAKYAWLLAHQSPITKIDVENGAAIALRKLDAGFFEVRLKRTTAAERRYLYSMATLPTPYSPGKIAKTLGGKTGRWSRIREQLIRKGLIYSKQRGELAYTVPHFAKYLQRHPNTTET